MWEIKPRFDPWIGKIPWRREQRLLWRREYPLQYSGLENSMDCIVHGVTKSRTRLSDFHSHQSPNAPRKNSAIWVPVSPLKTLLTCLSFLSVLSIQKVVYLIYSYLVCFLIFEYVYSLHSKYYQHRSRCLYRLCRKSLNMFLQLKQVVFYLFDRYFCSTLFSGGFFFYVSCFFSISVPWTWKLLSAQSCPTLCDPLDYTVHGILRSAILEWVAFPFSRGSSQPRDQTQVSCIAGRFFTSWATREAQVSLRSYLCSHLSAPSTLRLTFGRISQASIFIDSISSFQSAIYFLSAIPNSTIKVFISLQDFLVSSGPYSL